MGAPALASRKRKSPNGSAEPDEISRRPGKQKKVRLDLEVAIDPLDQNVRPQVKDSSQGRDKSLLPPEIWHHIFTLCPPKTLANLLSVNKLFNHYLDPSSSALSGSPVPVSQGGHGALGPLKPNAIWQASRRLFWPHMPVPLRSKTELEMWRLACSPVCQGCRKTDPRGPPNPPDSSHPGPGPGPGPGPDGVAVIWSFARCLCLSCLLKTSIKEVDLQLMPTIPSAILPALPFVLLGRDLVVIPGGTLEPNQPPSGLQVTKLYSSADVEALEKELATVKEMGPGTVDEWLKGLAGRGNELRHEASKWEKWEISGGLARMRRQLYPGYEPPKVPVRDSDSPTRSTPTRLSSRSPLSTIVRHPSLPSRPERTIEQVAELKAARKSEIERRAMRLDPPLTPAVLGHIPAFLAATQITAPLDENAWEVLKPRLLAQREEAEKKERESMKPIVQSGVSGRQLETTLATTKEARDLIDKQWEEIQAPLRARISGFADEIIRDKLDKGKRLSKDTCPKFATEVLIHVRKRFYDEIAKEAAAARAAGRSPVVDPPEGPFTQKLTLENMKWIFDTKIKPHTEPYRKEIFYCNGCEGNFKSFGFEGVVQHYAAKHTSALSVGSIVVHWRAEWPEQPPFASEGRPAKPHFYNQASGPVSFPPHTPLPPIPYHYPSPIPPPQGAQVLGYPNPSGPRYPVPSFGDSYSQAPPPQPQHYPGPPSYSPPLVPPTDYASQQPFAPPPNPYSPYGPPPPGAYAHPPIGADPTSGYNPSPSTAYPINYGPPPALVPPVYPGPATPYPVTYQTKLEDIARNSREIWNALANVKDLTGSARVFATIHHLIKRYRARFHETPPLTMFIDGLSNNKDMRPVRNINGLVCKACHLGLGNAASVEQERRSFSLPQLANHFQSRHIDPIAQHTNPQLDWVVDMVLLPDLQSISNALPAATEHQKSILGDAFPEALRPHNPLGPGAPPYQHREHHHGAYTNVSVSAQPAFNGNYSRLDNENGYPQAQHQLREGPGPEGHFGPPQVGRSEGPPVEHGYFPDRAPLKLGAEKGVHNSGNRYENPVPNHKKKGGKNKRGRPQDRDEGKRRPLEEEVQRQEHDARREDEKIKAMWEADRTGASRAYTSAKTEQEETRDRAYASEARQEFPRVGAAHARREPDVPNIMAALEQHLNEGHSWSARTEQPVLSDKLYLDSRGSGLPAEHRSASRAYGRYGEERNRSRSPAEHGNRYHQAASTPAVRERSVAPRPEEASYYSRPAPPVERGEASYDRYRVRSEYPEQHPQHPNDRRYELPPQRLDGNNREHTTPPEYIRYPENGPAPSRGPVELYEIVQVIDESGEYYIRRPVRREVEAPRVVYEGVRRDYRDADAYAAHEPATGPAVARPNRLVSRRPDLRTNPAYEEEYDPRYPGV
ncbi:hypothetical protein V8F06_009933 [Rhypophila decipiens]